MGSEMCIRDRDQTASDAFHHYLRQQYKNLYDEDLALMSGRQTSLDDQVRWKDASAVATIEVGACAELDKESTHVIDTEKGRFCVRRWQGRWIVHSAVCTHLLGPLDDSVIDENGTLTCPWHGYKFSAETGENIEKKCQSLASPPKILEVNGILHLQFEN